MIGSLMRGVLAAYLALVYTSVASAADVPARLQSVSAYTDTVDSILGDGLVSGDIAALRQATNNLTAQIDGIVAAEDSGPFVECAVELWAQADEVKLSLDQLSAEAIDAAAFQAEVAGLRRMAGACLDVWNGTR